MNGVTDLRARFFSSTRAHVASRVAQGAVGFVLVPYVLSHLSRAEYGLWTWLLALAGWLTLIDLGLVYGNVNPLARGFAAKDDRRIGEILAVAIGVHVALGLALLAAAIAAGHLVTSALPLPHRVLGHRALLVLVAAQVVTVVSYPFASTLSALQRLDLVHRIQLAQIGLGAAATVAILEAGGGISGLAWLQLGLAVFQLASRVFMCRRLHPRLRLSTPSLADVPGLVSGGVPILVLGLLGMVILSFERTVLGFVSDLAELTQYAVALRLVMVAREFPQAFLAALVPASAALDVAGDQPALERLHRRSFKLAAAAVSLVIAGLWICAPSAIFAWLGPGFDHAAALVRPLALTILVPLVTAPGVHVLIGRSRLAALMPGYLAWGLVFVVANAVWLSQTGFTGAGWGSAAINVVATALLLRWLDRQPAVATGGEFRILWKAVAIGAIAAAAGGSAVRLVGDGLRGESFLAALVAAAAGAAVVGVTHVALGWFSGLLDRDDRNIVAGALGIRRRSAGTS